MNLPLTILKNTLLKVISFIAGRTVKLVGSREDLSDAKIVRNPEIYSIDLRSVHLYGKNYYWLSFNGIALDPLFIISLERSVLVGNGIILNKKNEVILESTIFQKEYYEKLHQKHLVLKSRFQKKKMLQSVVISLSNALEDNYYHWVMESLTRILIAKETGDIQKAIIVINSSPLSFKADSLTFFCELPEQNIYRKPTRELLSCDAIVPSFPLTRNDSTNMTDVCHPYVIKALNKKAHEKFAGQPSSTTRFILSRKHADSRRIVNEDFLMQSLGSKDIHLIECESLTFQEQVKLFFNAQLVISTHGAGLTNIVFSRNATIIELFPEDRNERDAFAFVHISAVLGLRHHLLPYTSCNEHQDLRSDSDTVNAINNILATL